MFVLCARNRHDGWLIAGCGSDDATPRASLCCLCPLQALIATPDLICTFLYCFFFYGDGHHVVCVQSGNSRFYPLWLWTRSRRHGAWRKQRDRTTWPVLSLSGCRLHSVVPLAKRAEKIKPVQRRVKMKKLWMKVERERISKSIQVTHCVITQWASALNFKCFSIYYFPLQVKVSLLSQVPTWCPTPSCYCSSASRCSSWSWQWVRGSDAAALEFGTTSIHNWGASGSPVWWWVSDMDLECFFLPNSHLVCVLNLLY